MNLSKIGSEYERCIGQALLRAMGGGGGATVVPQSRVMGNTESYRDTVQSVNTQTTSTNTKTLHDFCQPYAFLFRTFLRISSFCFLEKC
jgi:hypothetical protein